MSAPASVQLHNFDESLVERSQLYALYVSLLRPYVEEAFGWDDEFQLERFSRHYPDKSIQLILAGMGIAGFVALFQTQEVMHIRLLLLRPDCQSRGIGREVMRLLGELAHSRGAAITLSCFRSNVGALKFYQKLGFRVEPDDEHFVRLTNAPQREILGP